MAGKQTSPPVLTEPLVELVAERFRVLGEPMRIRLLSELREEGKTVGELRNAVGASQQNISKHLGILLQAGFVSRSREGNQARYTLADESVFELCDVVCGSMRRQLESIDQVLREAAA